MKTNYQALAKDYIMQDGLIMTEYKSFPDGIYLKIVAKAKEHIKATKAIAIYTFRLFDLGNPNGIGSGNWYSSFEKEFID